MNGTTGTSKMDADKDAPATHSSGPGAGLVDVHELSRALNGLGVKVTPESAALMLNKYDGGKKGKLTQAEFDKLMTDFKAFQVRGRSTA